MGKKVKKCAAKQPESPKIEMKTKSNNEVSELKKLVEVLQGRISSLENKVETLENKVVVLESTLEVNQSTSDKQSLTTCISIPDVIASLFQRFRLNMENQLPI